MATKYARSTDGLDSDTGATWALAKATLSGASAAAAAGDNIYLSQAHAETSASAVSITLPGTTASPNTVLCANDAAEPPTATASTASISTTGASNLSVSGSGLLKGINLVCGNAANYAQLFINTGSTYQLWEDSGFEIGGSHSSCNMQIGGNNGSLSKTKLKNHKFKVLSTSQPIFLGGIVEIEGATFTSGCATPATGVFQAVFAGSVCKLTASGIDFSNLASTMNLLWTPSGSNAFQAVISNCKMPVGWSGALYGGANATPYARAEMHNCDSGNTNYKLWVEDWAGSIKTETVIVKTAGASDGTTPYSWKMVSSSNAKYPSTPLVSCNLPAEWNSSVGSAKTVTIDIIHDSATALNDDEVWVEVEYLGTSGYPLAVFLSDAKANPLATAAAQDASAATWVTTGLSAPKKQSLVVSITPQVAGFIKARVYLVKVSKTIYVDPKITVA